MPQRLRGMWRTATSAPWRRAPVLLLRRPGVLAAVAGACAVMVAAVASVPLFLSSAGTASIALQAEERCPRDTGVTLLAQQSAAELRTPTPDPFLPLDGRLTEVNRWARLQLVALAGPQAAEPEQVTVLLRDDATEHVEVLDGGRPGSDGIWITDRTAEATGLDVGDQAEVAGVTAPVAAVYRDVAGNSVDRFWCSNADLLLVEARGGDLVLPPPLVLVDRPTFVDVMASVGVATTPSLTEAALGDDLTITEADDLIDELACHGGDSEALAWCSDGQPLVPRRQGGFRRAPMPATGDADFVTRYFRSALPFVTERSGAIQTSVGSGIWPVAAFAALAGVGLVAAAASLWFDRRRREVVLLSVRGVSPAGLGAKAVLELSGALLAGAAAGVALAYGFVLWLGPGDAIEPVAVRRAAAGAAVALVGAALTVAAVVVSRIRTTQATSVRTRRFPLAAVPWELALVALTVVSYRRLGEWGVPVGRGADVSRVDVLGLLFPVLFLVSVVAVVSRLLAVGLRPLRAVSRTWPAALYLAVRRVARARTAVLGLVAASAVAVGVLAYAATMDRSLQTTLEAKAATFVGSDVAVRLPTGTAIPDTVADRATEVQVHSRSYVEAADREEVTVLAVDPETFGDIAFWDDTFADRSLDSVLEALAEPGDPAPAVVLGVDGDGPMELGVGDGFVHRMQIDPVEGVDAFPGMKRGKATVFVARAALEDAEIGGARTEAWIEGDHDEAIDDLRRGGVPFEEIRRSSDVADKSSFVTVQWTFGFMRSLGLSAGVLAVGGVAVHLDARRRDRVLGHAFLRRMGLSAAQHRRALLAELVATVLVGCAVGLAAALVEAWLAHGRIDPVPGFDPSPLLRPATGVIVTSAIVAVVVVVAAAVLAQRRAERDDPVEVLRAGA